MLCYTNSQFDNLDKYDTFFVTFQRSKVVRNGSTIVIINNYKVDVQYIIKIITRQKLLSLKYAL